MPQTDRGKAGRELHEIERSMAKWTMMVAVFTGALVLTAGIQNLFIYLQWYTAATVQQETREQQRAVVTNPGTLVVLPEEPEKAGSLVVAVPTFQNFGTTRTSHFKAVINLKYFDGGIPNNLDVTKPYLPVESADVIVAPGSVFQGIQVAMPGEDLIKARDQHGQILFWGTAEYADIFEPKKIHHISMCTIIKPQPIGNGKLGVQPIPYRADCNSNN